MGNPYICVGGFFMCVQRCTHANAAMMMALCVILTLRLSRLLSLLVLCQSYALAPLVNVIFVCQDK